jgi:hypothetical protein
LFAFREAGRQVSPVNNVTLLPENHCSTLFITGYKRLTEGGHRAFAFWAFWWGRLLLLFGLLLLAFGLFGFLIWEALEGKMNVEGKKNC